MLKKFYLLLAAAIMLSGFSTARGSESPNRFYVAPLYQNLNSVWSNKTDQNGPMWGVGTGFDYTQDGALYIGGDFAYATGRIKGSAGDDRTYEYFLEDRIGWTFSLCDLPDFTFVGFVGGGYYQFNQSLSEGNKFNSHFWYVPIGFRVYYDVACDFQLGLNFTVAPTFGGRWKIDCRKNAPTTVLWKVEMPFTYLFDLSCSQFDLSLVPFFHEWSFQRKGQLNGQRNIYFGARLELGYNF